MDEFGRPLSRSAGDAALEADTQQAAASRGRAFVPSYGGRRRAGEVHRSALALDGPLVTFGLPGVLLGFALSRFLQTPTAGGGAVKPVLHKKKETWGGPAPAEGEEVKLVIVVRTDLGMSIGKTAAQVAHAAVGIVSKLRKSRSALLARWEECGQTKICLQCTGVEELLQLAQAAMAAGLPCEVIQDAGRTEVAPGTHTVLAIGPGSKAAVDGVTGRLKLLR
jgi:PTH2 family peptidyl-tRNA hydrolase